MPAKPLSQQVPRRRRQRRVEGHRQWTLPATGLGAAEKGEEDDCGEEPHDRVVRTREASRSTQKSEWGEEQKGELAPIAMGAKTAETGTP